MIAPKEKKELDSNFTTEGEKNGGNKKLSHLERLQASNGPPSYSGGSLTQQEITVQK